MSDQIESAIAAAEDRQEEAFCRAHASMDFCAGFSTEALSETSLAEAMNFLHEARQWIDLAEDMGRDNEDALRRADALLSLLKDSKS